MELSVPPVTVPRMSASPKDTAARIQNSDFRQFSARSRTEPNATGNTPLQRNIPHTMLRTETAAPPVEPSVSQSKGDKSFYQKLLYDMERTSASDINAQRRLLSEINWNVEEEKRLKRGNQIDTVWNYARYEATYVDHNPKIPMLGIDVFWRWNDVIHHIKSILQSGKDLSSRERYV